MLELLLKRRSVSAKDMHAPGPSPEQLQQLLKAAHRVPDHGKLGPWRFVVFEGNARAQFGQKLAAIFHKDNPDASDKLLNFQADLLNRAPLVIAVISTAAPHIKIPEWEQVLSAGAACQNLLVAAHAMGYGAQWLTEWYSYHAEVKQLLDADEDHQIAGFIYIGSYDSSPDERVRPPLEERVTYWN